MQKTKAASAMPRLDGDSQAGIMLLLQPNLPDVYQWNLFRLTHVPLMIVSILQHDCEVPRHHV